jgi:hypothetical protein
LQVAERIMMRTDVPRTARRLPALALALVINVVFILLAMIFVR